MAEKEKTQMDDFTLPEGRVTNASLFTKDAFNEKSVPSYKIEVAIPADSEELEDLEELLLDAADAHWGDGTGDDEDLVIPLLEGNKLARKREKKGKEGNAYKDMVVIRCSTIYNKDGIDGPGGMQVFDEEAEPVSPARQGEIYPGCYGIVAVSLGFYENDDGDPAFKFYLAAFQKTKDGEKLVKASDRSNMFKPTGRKPKRSSREGRESRRGGEEREGREERSGREEGRRRRRRG